MVHENKEINEKVNRIRSLLDGQNKKAMLITEQPNFSWLTGGGRGFLGLASTKACASVLVTKQRLYLLANNIEGERLMQEENLSGFCELVKLPWQEDGELDRLAGQMADGSLVYDFRMEKELAAFRQQLCAEEQERYRTLCRDAAGGMEDAIRTFYPEISEFEAAGRIAAALWKGGMEPISLFVAADDRVGECRHFIPTDKRAGRQIIASICARRGGLVASVTRTAAFGTPSETLGKYYGLLLEVEAKGWDALCTQPDLGHVYQKICEAYAKRGMNGEWQNHHQGGLTGYKPREIRMDERTTKEIRAGQAFAFNPSCNAAKVEDTVLLTDSGIEVMSIPGKDWPVLEAGSYCMPDILRLGG